MNDLLSAYFVGSTHRASPSRNWLSISDLSDSKSLCPALRSMLRAAFVGASSVLFAVSCWAQSAPSFQFTGTGNVGPVNVGASSSFALSYSVVAGGTAGATKVVTGGAPDLDFTLGRGSTCVGAVAASSTCKVVVNFAPRFAGFRTGAVELTDANGNILATTLVSGTGVGPQVAFGPGVPIAVLATGLDYPGAVAADMAGNVFIADTENHRVVKISAGGAQLTVPITGLQSPVGVAVDGAGNIFVVDSGLSRVVEWLAGGSAQITVPTTGLNYPNGLAVDAAGNLYIADTFNNRVVEIAAGGGPQTTVPATGLNYPNSVAVNGAGDLFIADSWNNRVVELPAGGDPQVSIGTGLNYPGGVAVDAAGDLFIADTENSRVVEVPAGGAPQITFLSGFAQPPALALDGAGNLYVSDSDHDRVVEVQRAQWPTVAFAATTVGSVSSDSPQALTVQNVGNAALNGSGLSLSDTTDFAQIAGSGTPPDCTDRFSLTPGARCDLNLTFAPKSAGPLTSAITLTDNAGNVAGATQEIELSGTGVAYTAPLAQLSTTTLDFGTTPFGSSPVSKQVIVTNVGGEILTVSASSGGPSFSLSSTACGGSLPAGKSCALTVWYEAATVGNHKTLLTVSTNGAISPTVEMRAISVGVGAKSTVLDFGTIPAGSSQVLPLVIANAGVPGPVSVGTSINGPSYRVTASTCGAGVNMNSTCTLLITFAPKLAGEHYDHLTITAGDGTVTSVALKGIAGSH
jgi:sugar lactone lactonase YvrE